MEGETTLKHRTLTGKSDEDVNSTPASTDTGKTVTENHGKMNDKDEDDKMQSEAWQKYKSMSFMDKYKMEKSARVPSVMYYGDVFSLSKKLDGFLHHQHVKYSRTLERPNMI